MFLIFASLSVQKEEIHPNETLYVKFDGDEKTNNKHYTFYGGSITHNVKDGDRTVTNIKWNSEKVNPGGAAALESHELFSYGHFSACFKSPDSSNQPNAGIISSFFTYNGLKERLDKDGNGIKDHAELDFEFLAAAPTKIYITSHIGYEDDESQYERIARTVDLATGEEEMCQHKIKKRGDEHSTKTPLTDQPPVPKLPNYRNTNYNVFGIDYLPDKGTFWVEVDGKRYNLFVIPGKYLPHYPMYILGNVWWSRGWTPSNNKNAKEMPNLGLIDPSIKYQWIKYEPLTKEEVEEAQKNGTNNGGSGSNTGLIIGIVIAVVVVLAIGIGATVFFLKKKKESTSEFAAV